MDSVGWPIIIVLIITVVWGWVEIGGIDSIKKEIEFKILSTSQDIVSYEEYSFASHSLTIELKRLKLAFMELILSIIKAWSR